MAASFLQSLNFTFYRSNQNKHLLPIRGTVTAGLQQWPAPGRNQRAATRAAKVAVMTSQERGTKALQKIPGRNQIRV
jgi:hypothetical protein